jgi:hypothetical protein
MRKSLFCLLFSLFQIITWAQPSVDKKLSDNIAKNKINSQTSWEYKYNGNSLEATGTKTSVTLYNASGNVTEVTTYNTKGLVMNVEKYRYDGAGNKIEYSRYSGSSDGPVAYQKISKYDARNNVTEESGYDGVEKFLNKYSYDTQGNLLEIIYQKNGVLKEKRTFQKDGLKTNVLIYNASGKLISKLLLTFDSKDNMLEETVYGVNQDIIEKKTYDYDDKKNLKRESKFKLNKMTLRTTYNYNESGDLTEITEEGPESAKFVKKSIAYNSKGFITEIKWRRKGNEDYNSITYTYDARGICTQSETFYPSSNYKALTKYIYGSY